MEGAWVIQHDTTINQLNTRGTHPPNPHKTTQASFNEGGTGVFVPTLLRLMDQLAQEATRPAPQPPAPQSQQPGGAGGGYGYGGYGGQGGYAGVGPAAIPVAQAVSEPGAYVDPADPSRVLVSTGSQQPPMVRGI